MKEEIEKLNTLYVENNILDPEKEEVRFDGRHQLCIRSNAKSRVLVIGTLKEINSFIKAQLALFDVLKKNNKEPIKIFRIKIEEQLSRTIEIVAKDIKEATYKVQQLYDDSSIILDSGDFLDVDISPDVTDLDCGKDSFRICNKCGCKMSEGYLINGAETYCSKSCLKKVYSEDDITNLDIGGDTSESYYTSWIN